jgi:hypothetical protein
MVRNLLILRPSIISNFSHVADPSLRCPSTLRLGGSPINPALPVLSQEHRMPCLINPPHQSTGSRAKSRNLAFIIHEAMADAY